MARILIALDESTTSMRAARTAAELFAGDDTEFLVVNVAQVAVPAMWGGRFGMVTPMDAGLGATAWPVGADAYTAAPEAAVMEDDELAARVERLGLTDAETVTESGDPVEAIVTAADENDVDVIVVGSHHKGFLGRLLDPSVSAGVVRAAHRPVLVVPEPDAD